MSGASERFVCPIAIGCLRETKFADLKPRRIFPYLKHVTELAGQARRVMFCLTLFMRVERVEAASVDAKIWLGDSKCPIDELGKTTLRETRI